MKFLHITDTHLGYHQYGLEERAQDFYDVFNEAVEIAIEKKVDFVIHTGDFFHTSRPSNAVILQGIQLVNKLKNASIPIFLIPGNHDRGNRVKDISPLHILKDFGANLIEHGTLEHEGVFISGIKYLSKIAIKKIGSIRPILEKFLEHNRNGGFHILMLHQEFIPHFPNGLYLSKEVPEGFNYIGIGHLHEMTKPFKHKDCTVVYPGSTEFTAFSKNEENVPKGIYIIEETNGNTEYEFIQLKRRRPFISFKFQEESFEKVVQHIKHAIEKTKATSNKAPVITLKGHIEKLSLKDLNTILAKNGIIPDSENILHINFLLKKKEENQKQKDIFSIASKEIDIEKELRNLIGDEHLLNHVYEIISIGKSMESIDDFKSFLKENLKYLEI